MNTFRLGVVPQAFVDPCRMIISKFTDPHRLNNLVRHYFFSPHKFPCRLMIFVPNGHHSFLAFFLLAIPFFLSLICESFFRLLLSFFLLLFLRATILSLLAFFSPSAFKTSFLPLCVFSFLRSFFCGLFLRHTKRASFSLLLDILLSYHLFFWQYVLSLLRLFCELLSPLSVFFSILTACILRGLFPSFEFVLSIPSFPFLFCTLLNSNLRENHMFRSVSGFWSNQHQVLRQKL